MSEFALKTLGPNTIYSPLSPLSQHDILRYPTMFLSYKVTGYLTVYVSQRITVASQADLGSVILVLIFSIISLH